MHLKRSVIILRRIHVCQEKQCLLYGDIVILLEEFSMFIIFVVITSIGWFLKRSTYT